MGTPTREQVNASEARREARGEARVSLTARWVPGACYEEARDEMNAATAAIAARYRGLAEERARRDGAAVDRRDADRFKDCRERVFYAAVDGQLND